ncbi:transcriptional regulator [Phyllobacterium endophyticum]|uniref:Transcriptional regulator n=1 Tax=Phyllobacterium endophyticum TaxID=1149773 RepID=A0A2P7AKJ1_9HYPH|nr:WYL domain-containing protein [Phyllobacterium endophyticum]PSH54720.1 transcriptional regulator [Phyllobacterium endophyticum]TYR40662.1 transcriptional regulator [Phyllobacterium endophyticum]
MRWGTEQRLEFIEFRAFWEGGIRRGDITDRFGVSVPQASNDLALYQKLEPNNLRYDASEKRYVPTVEFTPRFMKPNADRYLIQLKAIADHVIGLDETWITIAPQVDAMPVPTRRIDPVMLKRFIAVIRSKKSVEVYYQSMSGKRPEALWRRITPHAFGHDGLRWHVRAYCHLDNKFKDFILSRCRDLRNEDITEADANADRNWTSFFDVVLGPNPALTPSQRDTVSSDYDMRDGEVIIPVRYALLYYFEKRLRLDVVGEHDKPTEKPIIIKNWEEFCQARQAAAL